MMQWDFQNKGIFTSPARLSFVLEVPLRHLRPSVIYSVPCNRILQRAYCTQCNFVYYGQTERSLKTRIAEHKKAVASFNQNSKVASHVHQFSHNMNFANVKVVDVESHYHERLFLEAWHSPVDPNAGNDHIVLPEAYKGITRASP